MRALIVVPTYNERETILPLTQAVLDLSPEFDVCVVDDSSPDGTADLLKKTIGEKSEWQSRVSLMVRKEKNGRGGAVREGFARGLRSGGYPVFVEMDSDFSHRPAEIVEGIKRIEAGDDVSLGCRYPDGKIVGWPLHRRAFSRCANYLARSLIRWDIPDYTNGFRFYTARAAEFMINQPQRHTGYIYLSESLSYLMRGGFRISHFATYFENRKLGVSKTGMNEVLHAFWGLFAIAWRYRVQR